MHVQGISRTVERKVYFLRQGCKVALGDRQDTYQQRLGDLNRDISVPRKYGVVKPAKPLCPMHIGWPSIYTGLSYRDSNL